MKYRESVEVIGPASLSGAGLYFKFTNVENKLVKWVLERHGFGEASD